MMTDEMKNSLLTMAKRDAPAARMHDRSCLLKQRAEKRMKQEILRKQGMNKSSEAFIDSLYYFEMYSSLSCWKTTSEVNRELKRLKSNTSKLNALKENIRIRVLGLGWTDLSTPWSKSGICLTVSELTVHLKYIISQENKRTIPSKPPALRPKRKTLPLLGNIVKELTIMDTLEEADCTDFIDSAKQTKSEREAKGVGD